MATENQKKTTKRKPRAKSTRSKKSNQLTESQAKMLLKRHLKGFNYVDVDWSNFQRINPNKYVFQLTVDKISLDFLNKIMEVPLVDDVYFFSKVGTGRYGINLLFKLHIIFKEL